MSAQDVWVSLQSKPHGHSGRGVSYYKMWNQPCAKRAQLDTIREDAGLEREHRTDARGYDYLNVGVYYHMLHEIAARGQAPDEAWEVGDCLDVNFTEALRLFHGWKRCFGTVEEKYGGVVVGCEMALPTTDTGRAQVKQMFGGELTGRVDLVMQIHDVEAVQRHTQTEHSPGLSITPGTYIVDFKTAGKYSEGDFLKYTHDLQARNYLTLYNIEHKERPAKGIIFDQLVKHTNFSRVPVYAGSKVKQHSSFHAYVQMVDSEDIPVLRTLVGNGMRNKSSPQANPTACIGTWDVCPHLTSGECRGH